MMILSRPASLALVLAAITASTLAAQSASLSITKTDSPDPVAPGGDLVYTITIGNEGPSSAEFVSLSDDLPAGTTFVSLAAPAAWTCGTPAVGSGGNVTCSIDSLGVGSAAFTLTVNVAASVPDATVIDNQAAVSSETPDPDDGDNTGSAQTLVQVPAPLALTLTKVDGPDPVTAGDDLTYTLTLALDLPGAVSASLADTLPGGTTFVSLAAAAGWTCSTPVPGETGAIDCSSATPASGDHVFTLVVNVGPLPTGSVLQNHAAATAVDEEERVFAAEDDESTAVLSPATVTASKSVTGTFQPGDPVTYTIVLANAGPGDQPDAAGDELHDVLPAPLSLVSASATTGTALADPATNTVTWNGAIPAGGSVTITISAVLSAAAAPGSVANQGTISYDDAGDGTNGATGVTDDPATAAEDDPTSFVVAAPQIVEVPAIGDHGLGIFAAALAAAAVLLLRVFRSAIAA